MSCCIFVKFESWFAAKAVVVMCSACSCFATVVSGHNHSTLVLETKITKSSGHPG